MIRKSLPIILFLLLTPFLNTGYAQTSNWWQAKGDQFPIELRSFAPDIPTYKAQFISVDFQQLEAVFESIEDNSLLDKYSPILIPGPDGKPIRFLLKEASIMEPALQKKYPQIRTYQGYDVNQKNRWIRIDRNSQNWHAMISDAKSAYYIDPVNRKENSTYQVYTKENCIRKELPACAFHSKTQASLSFRNQNTSGEISQIKRNYRIAISAAYSYTNFYGGTKEGAMAGITTTLNRVNLVYERDFGIKMTLVANNDTLIVTNPDLNVFKVSLLETRDNQTFIDNRLGSENYDIGHVLGAGSNAYASPAVVCDNLDKAKGFTSIPNPVGDPFDIDFVAHEIGHQFGANHTFNGINGGCEGPNWHPPTAFEPGSGSTIMAYAGLCRLDDVSPRSDDYFHGGSIQEIYEFISFEEGNNCPQFDTLENTAPEIDMPQGGLYIPILTPFEIEGAAFDQEGDSLTFCWEQMDIGSQAPLGSYRSGNIPLFVSFPPQPTALRSFPRMSNLLQNQFLDIELLPNQSRELNFQLTVRDNNPNGAAVSWDQVQYFVDGDSGPFSVNNRADLFSGAYQQINWEVAGTNEAPISTDSVDVFLSRNGGLDFGIFLGRLPNTGGGLVYIPEMDFTQEGRIKVKAHNNIYFDINDRNIPISPASEANLGLGLLIASEELVFCNQDTIRIPIFYNLSERQIVSPYQLKLV